MIPHPEQALTDLAVRITTHIVPTTTSTFAQADGQLLTVLLVSMAQDFERAVANRMADINEIKTLIQTLQKHVDNNRPFSNMDQTNAFLRAEPLSLKLSDVNALHAQGFDCLIEMQIWAEKHNQPLNLSIWQLLRRHSERNKFQIPAV